jgi:hypothetical protein
VNGLRRQSSRNGAKIFCAGKIMDGATFCAAQPVKPLYCVGHANNNVGTGSIVLLFFVCDYYSLYLLGVLYLFYP